MSHHNRVQRLARASALGIVLTVASVGSAFAHDGWATMTPAPTARFAAVSAERNGRIYVTGWVPTAGPLLHIYNPGSDTWTTGAAPGLNRSFASLGVAGGKLYLVGGCINSDCTNLTNALEVYDPVANSWSLKAPMPTPRLGAAAAVMGGKLYVTSGSTHCGACLTTNVTEVYNPATNTWATGAPIPTGRQGAMGAVVEDLFYVIGGGVAEGFTNVVEVYDPFTNSWSARSRTLPTSRQSAAVGVIDGHIYLAGGINAAAPYLAVTEMYDPSDDTFATLSPMPTARRYASGSVVDSKLYVIGGFNGTYLTTNEEYSPSFVGEDGLQGPQGPAGSNATVPFGTALMLPVTGPTATPPAAPSGYALMGVFRLERPAGDSSWFAVYVKIAP